MSDLLEMSRKRSCKEGKHGILTFHSALNEGAILQSYCSVAYLREATGLDFEIIDFNYLKRMQAYEGTIVTPRILALKAFIRNLRLSDASFHFETKTYLAFVNDNYDSVFIGSDEVWKVAKSQRPFFPPFPNVYYTSFDVGVPKISWAASVGDTDFERLPDEILLEMRSRLQRFELLLVRDSRTVDFLRFLGVTSQPVLRIPDPTFSIDLSITSESLLKSKLLISGFKLEGKTLGLFTPYNDEIHELAQEFKEQEYQLFYSNDYQGPGDNQLNEMGLSPIEWFNVTKYFDLCISWRYHVCISCLQNGVPFVAYDLRDIQSLSGNSKLRDLMIDFELMEYYFSPEDSSVDLLHFVKEIDWTKWPKEKIASKANSKREVYKQLAKELLSILS